MRWGLLVVVCVGCGGTTTGGTDPGVGSCQQMVMMSGFTFRTCVDYTGLTSDQETTLRNVCSAHDAGTGVTVDGTFTKTKCDHTGTLGGCRIGSGSFTQTVWYWTATGPGFDITLYKDTCTTAGGMWLNP